VQDRTTRREFVLAARDGEVEVFEKASGLKLTTRKFTLTRGGKERVVVYVPDDRKVAEWVLSLRGKVRGNGEEREITAPKDLPAGASRLTSTNLSDIKVSDEGLAQLEGLTNLTHLYLGRTQVSNEGLVHLRELTNLRHLALHDNKKVTNEGLLHLKGLPNLAW